MNDDNCQHNWGPAEECETSMGILLSPVCQHCGAVKLELDQRARGRLEFDRRMAAAGIKTPLPAAAGPGFVRSSRPLPRGETVANNLPPPGVRVQPFQAEIFTDV